MKQLFNTPEPRDPRTNSTPEIFTEDAPYFITNTDRIVNFENQDYIFILPARTGSRSIFKLLIDTGFLKIDSDNWVPTHEKLQSDFTGKVIVSVRHPLDRFISGYMVAAKIDKNLTIESMIAAIGIEGAQIFDGGFKWTSDNIIYNAINQQTPDYIIYTETIESDLLNIPFINDISMLTQIGKTGTAEERNAIIQSIIFNRQLADKINTVFHDDFVNFGYEFIWWKL